MGSLTKPRGQRYGKKGAHNLAIAAASFTAAETSRKASDDTGIRSRHLVSDTTEPSVGNSLDDVTATLSGLSLDGKQEKTVDPAHFAERSGTKEQSRIVSVRPSRAKQQHDSKVSSRVDIRYDWLKPLTTIYQRTEHADLVISSWSDLLSADWSLRKIAESSYAEVYKVTNNEGSSVLKLMALRPPKGVGSRRQTAVLVESVVSEVMIMNLMAEIPGFLEYKCAHIIEGRPPAPFAAAYDEYALQHGTDFPRPHAYHKEQLFLALELSDAGTDVEHFEVANPLDLWDILLGVTLALAAGEEACQFEHRDLHEGNVCVMRLGPRKLASSESKHRFGYSGLQVTLLDYTLSRAGHDSILYRDLESDLEIFAESSSLQNEIYRRMRTWTLYHEYGASRSSPQEAEAVYKGSWSDFNPYTNVMWIWYLLTWMIDHYKVSNKNEAGLGAFLCETKDLRIRLDPNLAPSASSFDSASKVLEYAINQGWITADDVDCSVMNAEM